MSWQIRHAGSPAKITADNAEAVVNGLMNGDWEPSDEILGDGERNWKTIEDHPKFSSACEDLTPEKPAVADDNNIDMNPMIDVALVLLIFFILTTSYASLRRVIDLPDAPTEKKGAVAKTLKKDDVKDRIFKLKIYMEEEKPIIKIEERIVLVDDLDKEMKEVVRVTGRKEMYMDIDPSTPWGIEAKVYDAARGANVTQIYWPKAKK